MLGSMKSDTIQSGRREGAGSRAGSPVSKPITLKPSRITFDSTNSRIFSSSPTIAVAALAAKISGSRFGCTMPSDAN